MSFYTYKCFYRDLLLYISHLCPGNDFLNVDTKLEHDLLSDAVC